MKPILILSLAAILSASISFAVVRCAGSCAAAPAPAVGAEDVARLSRALADSEARQAALAKSVEDLRAGLALRSSQDSRVPMGDIEGAVNRALAQQREATPASEAAAKEKPAAAKAFDLHAAVQELQAPGLTREEKMAKWKAIADAGALDDAVAMFEQYAREHPGSAAAQVELGGAYLQKVFKAGNGPEAGVWATKADQAFDAGLAVDDHNWDARFSKAVSLSFWPPVFGKQTEAINHFEILAAQQAQQTSEPKFAQTWLLLGNMYQQLGKADQALATWQKGLALFPGNESLQQQIANAHSH
jgi:tetratricopeptide (TPR) repeat protein